MNVWATIQRINAKPYCWRLVVRTDGEISNIIETDQKRRAKRWARQLGATGTISKLARERTK